MTTYHDEPQIQLVLMPQLVNAVDSEDDWTGVTDAAARRKRQNRLNVRAYRRRKLLESKGGSGPIPASEPSPIKVEPEIPCWDEDQQAISSLPASLARTLPSTKQPLIPYDPMKIPSAMKIIFPLSSDHLITILQFNVLRAGITNRILLSGGYLPAATDECTSAALSVLPFPNFPSYLPPTLHPTQLQLTVPHESWIDTMAHPRMRDNMILAAGTFDEDALWADCIGGLFEGFPDDEVGRRGLMVWGDPWDMDMWEVSKGFWERWGWGAKGCEEQVLRATNRWREKRGEEPLVWEIEDGSYNLVEPSQRWLTNLD